MERVWHADVEEDPKTGELYLTFPQEMLNELGWTVGTVLEWYEEPTGEWVLRKAKNKED
ncbi:MAG: AbrB/MazE/SpoVT family DNA-binding domain-containing protein [Fischerella sp.]|nr:AbrB/MazE/SpoVT family DNA-binding domain-containing protein [Fischerella sp.]